MGPHLGLVLRRHPAFQNGDLEPWEYHPRLPLPLAKRILRDTLLGLNTLHRRGIVHGDLHPGNTLFTNAGLGNPLTDAAVEEGLSQGLSEGNPLQRRDGKRDLWAPSYLLEPSPLLDQVSFDLDPVVKIADLCASIPRRPSTQQGSHARGAPRP
ncbi:hypothetical protein VTI74DRAFT_4708 [Chaetomium olivicolor]